MNTQNLLTLSNLSNSSNIEDINLVIRFITEKMNANEINEDEKNILLSLLDSQNPQIRDNSIEALRYHPVPELKDKLFTLMTTDPDVNVRAGSIFYYCVSNMNGSKDKELIHLLFNYCLDDTLHDQIRISAYVGIFSTWEKDVIRRKKWNWLFEAYYKVGDEFTFESVVDWCKCKYIILETSEELYNMHKDIFRECP